MTCPHAETTAILALFDEAPPGFDAHRLGCTDCQQVLAAHRETLDIISPHLPPARAPAPPTPRRRHLLLAGGAAAALAVAAAVTLVVMVGGPDALPTRTAPTPSPLALELLDDGTLDDDAGLLALELELALMNLEDAD